MRRLIRSLWGAVRHPRQVRIPLPPAAWAMGGISALGLAGLCVTAGAAVMYFQVPPADFFEKAFSGSKAWRARGAPTDPAAPGPRGLAREGVWQDKPDRTS